MILLNLKTFSFTTLISGLVSLIISVPPPFLLLKNYTSAHDTIAIIGGADIPTYKFVIMRLMSGWSFCLILFGISCVITALFCLIFSKTVKAHCTLKTSAISVGLAAVGAIGLHCAFMWYTFSVFHEMSQHPISYPVSIILGTVCLCVFIALVALYFKSRKACWSVKGLVIDVLFGVIYLPTFFFAFTYLYDLLRLS